MATERIITIYREDSQTEFLIMFIECFFNNDIIEYINKVNFFLSYYS